MSGARPCPKMRRILTPAAALCAMLAWIPPVHAADAMWLQSVNYDNLNKLNLKEGIAFMGKPVKHEHAEPWPYSDVPFSYADAEAGGEGYKFTLGKGMIGGPELPFMSRIGLSYAHFRTQNLAGVEAVFSSGIPATETTFVPLGLSLKFGYYVGLAGTPNRLMIGLGFGM